MKKKIVVLMGLFIFLLCGVAVADVNGYFSGYPIANVKVNGKTVAGDTPAINFNGRTMVPIRFVSEAMGAKVAWDGSTETAIITLPMPAATSTNDIDMLKLYSYNSDYYNHLGILGDILAAQSRGLSIAYEDYNLTHSRDQYEKMVTEFNNAINDYNKTVSENAISVSRSAQMGVDLSDTNVILDKYGEAIDYYKLAFDGLGEYMNSSTTYDFYEYLNNSKKAFDLAYSGRKMTLAGYTKYYRLVQNY